MKRIYILILIGILISSCEDDDDCNQACFTPPETFLFEIVDRESGENLFSNGTFDPNEITIIDNLNNNEAIEFSFISENNINIIQIGSIGWETEIVDLQIDISGHHIFNFYADATRIVADCCSYTEFNEITIADAEFEMNPQTGIYRIFVE